MDELSAPAITALVLAGLSAVALVATGGGQLGMKPLAVGWSLVELTILTYFTVVLIQYLYNDDKSGQAWLVTFLPIILLVAGGIVHFMTTPFSLETGNPKKKKK
jgi:ABC-type methionine transport system permease subunit